MTVIDNIHPPCFSKFGKNQIIEVNTTDIDEAAEKMFSTSNSRGRLSSNSD